MKISDYLRLYLEKEIDAVIADPVGSEFNAKMMIKAAELDANIDTVLAFYIGAWFIRLDTVRKFGSQVEGLDQEDFDMIIPVISRRIVEIKEAMIKSRLGT